jgi:hypothetical protein
VLEHGSTLLSGIIIIGDPHSNEFSNLMQARPPTDTRMYAHYAWPAACVGAGRVLPVFEDPLFIKADGVPLKIHLHPRLQGRLQLLRTVHVRVKFGGMIYRVAHKSDTALRRHD